MEINVTRHRYVAAWAQKSRMAEDQLGGKQTLAQQALRSVKVRQQRVEQRRSLAHHGFDRRPFLLPDYERQRIERPWAIGAAKISIHIVGNAVVVEQATSFLPSASEALRS